MRTSAPRPGDASSAQGRWRWLTTVRVEARPGAAADVDFGVGVGVVALLSLLCSVRAPPRSQTHTWCVSSVFQVIPTSRGLLSHAAFSYFFLYRLRRPRFSPFYCEQARSSRKLSTFFGLLPRGTPTRCDPPKHREAAAATLCPYHEDRTVSSPKAQPSRRFDRPALLNGRELSKRIARERRHSILLVVAVASTRRRRSGAGDEPRRKKRPRIAGPTVVSSTGSGNGSGGVGGEGGEGVCRQRDLERGGGGRGATCLATISSSVAGSAGGCGPVVGLPSYKKRQGNAAWGRGGRGRGRGRGVALLGPNAGPGTFPPGLHGVGPGLREVVNILGERNQAGTLTGVGPLPGASDPEDLDDEEEGTSPKRPPRPLYRRLFNYVRQAWTGVKFALDSEYEEEQTPRYRPDSLASLCRATRFTEAELKRIYRGFKAECPTGVVREDTFKCIYSQFFPQGANTSQYAHYVFNTLDQDHSGLLSFEDFVTGLSILSRGSMDEKLRWTFSLYDINGDGCITRDEMTDIVTAVYDLMGKFADPTLDREGVRDKVDRMFQKMDGNRDGVVTLNEFLDACRGDADISSSMAALDTAF